jgi:predicted component of type VI protein secretion system
MAIQVQLKHVRTGEQKTLWFEQSPIRIGRNQLNNVAINDHHVSEWHGIIRFDGTGVYYFDLGSTNGTLLEGNRLPKNTVTPLTASSQLVVWPFQISVVAQGVAPSTGSVHQTMVWGGPHKGSEAPAVAEPAVAKSEPSSATWQINREQEASRPNQVAASHPPTQGERAAADQKSVMRLFETFSEAFIGLKKGYEEFGAEVGVRPLSGGTPLHRARSSREVIDYLLNPSTDVEARVRDLRAVFADMGIHHIALMEGLNQGIRALLESLDPSVQESPTRAGLFNRSKSKAEWRDYVERFATLIAEDAALHAEIFGEEFARGYASVALGGSKQGPDEPEGTE